MKNFVIRIQGPICSGKTTVSKYLHQKMPRTFLISADRLKWLISEYNPSEDRETIALMVLDVIRHSMEAGWNVIHDSSMLWLKPETRQLFDDYYTRYGIKVVSFNLDAPLPILLDRLKERHEEERRKNQKLSVSTEEKYMESYNQYQKLKKEYKTFDSFTTDAETIAEMMFENLQYAQ